MRLTDIATRVGGAVEGDGSVEITGVSSIEEPEPGRVLVERYPGAVVRSPYVGKHGWNIITLDGTVPNDELADLVDTSYALVVAKLPKKDRPR